MVGVPGTMEVGPVSPPFWGSLTFALAVAFVAGLPVDRYLIARGKGHMVVQEYGHGDHGHQ